jgi:transcriptional regulator GlxA family with amidase domain
VGSWTSATRLPATTKGVLRPARTAELANLQRDHPVSAALQPFVERYWSVRWDLTGQPPYRSEVLSHPSVNVAIESGSEPRFGFALPTATVHGVVTRRFVVDLVGAGRVTAVKFRPGGFTAFTGVAAARNTVTLLGGELGLDPDELTAAVLSTDDDADRAAALDAALAPRAPAPAAAYLDLQELLVRMLSDRTLIRVDQVAGLAGVTVRSLQRLFSSYVGVGPKAVLARYRLQNAVASIDAGEVEDLAALAASLGWFDQAHFTRDFRSVVGTTPSRYLQAARDAGA